MRPIWFPVIFYKQWTPVLKYRSLLDVSNKLQIHYNKMYKELHKHAKYKLSEYYDIQLVAGDEHLTSKVDMRYETYILENLQVPLDETIIENISLLTDSIIRCDKEECTFKIGRAHV